MIYSVVFLYALLNCYSCCYCYFIGQINMRKSVTLSVTDYENGKEENREEQKENPFSLIH